MLGLPLNDAFEQLAVPRYARAQIARVITQEVDQGRIVLDSLASKESKDRAEASTYQVVAEGHEVFDGLVRVVDKRYGYTRNEYPDSEPDDGAEDHLELSCDDCT